MKNQQQDEARRLYIQSNQSKTKIAEQLGVSRRTVYQWSVDGDWETLRASARCMPAILAQKVSHLIGHFTDHLLRRDSAYQPVNKDDVYVLNRLVHAVTKLRSGSTAAENMETFTLFMEQLAQKDASLAEEVAPHVGDFIHGKATLAHSHFSLNGYNADGSLPFTGEEQMEKHRDQEDFEAIVAEKKGIDNSVQDEPEFITVTDGIRTWKKPNPKYAAPRNDNGYPGSDEHTTFGNDTSSRPPGSGTSGRLAA